MMKKMLMAGMLVLCGCATGNLDYSADHLCRVAEKASAGLAFWNPTLKQREVDCTKTRLEFVEFAIAIQGGIARPAENSIGLIKKCETKVGLRYSSECNYLLEHEFMHLFGANEVQVQIATRRLRWAAGQ